MIDFLNAIRGAATETADTGTFADGVHAVPAGVLRVAANRDLGRAAYARDYGAQRQVKADLIGYA